MSHSVHIGWSDINASHIPNKYTIYRSETPLDMQNLPLPLVTNLPKEQLDYLDETVEFGKTYYYVVSSYTASNEEFGDIQTVHVKENIYYTQNSGLYKIGYDSTTTRPKYVRDFDSTITAIDCDVHGHVYVLTQQTLYKIDYKGDPVWDVALGTIGYSVTADAEQNVYVGILDYVRKYDVNGTMAWQSSNLRDINVGGNSNCGRVYCMSIDQQNRIWAGMSYLNNDYGVSIARLDTDGSILFSDWITTNSNYAIMGVAVDSALNGYVLIAQNSSLTSSTRLRIAKYLPIGERVYYLISSNNGFGTTSWSYARPGNDNLFYDPKNDTMLMKSGTHLEVVDMESGLATEVGDTISYYRHDDPIALDARSEMINIDNTSIQRYDNLGSQQHSNIHMSVNRNSLLSIEPGRYAIERGLYTPPL